MLSLLGCTKDSANSDPVFQLPPETQIGANTFGVTINGKVYSASKKTPNISKTRIF